MKSSFCTVLSANSSESGTETGSIIADDLGMRIPEHSVSPESCQQIVELYDEVRPSLNAYLCWLGMNADQAEDVIQETFLRLICCRFRPGSENTLRGWVFRVAHNLSMDVHRFQRRWSWNHNHEEPLRLVRQKADPGP